MLQMICRYCKNPVTRVINSRKFDDTAIRVRICKACNRSFVTYEIRDDNFKQSPVKNGDSKSQKQAET